jgi:hypothetical protein
MTSSMVRNRVTVTAAACTGATSTTKGKGGLASQELESRGSAGIGGTSYTTLPSPKSSRYTRSNRLANRLALDLHREHRRLHLRAGHQPLLWTQPKEEPRHQNVLMTGP